MAQFINFPGNLVIRQPFQEKYTDIYGFMVNGDINAIQQMIDTRLNFMDDRPDLKYFAVSSKVLFAYTTSPFGQSMTSDMNMGIAAELALITYVLVAACHPDGKGNWIPDRLLLYLPYTVVDNHFSMIVGRESFGFNKCLGNFQFPANPKLPDLFTVSVYSFKQFTPTTRALIQPWVTISMDQPGNTASNSKQAVAPHKVNSWTDIVKEFLRDMESGKLNLGFLWHELKDLLTGTVPMVFLRQLRDIADSDQACYQAVIEVNGKVGAIESLPHLGLGTYTLDINPLESHPIEKDLGLQLQEPCSFYFRIMMDLQFPCGKEVWRAKDTVAVAEEAAV